jgi:hypothetical protein
MMAIALPSNIESSSGLGAMRLYHRIPWPVSLPFSQSVISLRYVVGHPVGALTPQTGDHARQVSGLSTPEPQLIPQSAGSRSLASFRLAHTSLMRLRRVRSGVRPRMLTIDLGRPLVARASSGGR